MKAQDTKIINLCDPDNDTTLRQREFNLPRITIVGEDTVDEKTDEHGKNYYYALVRYADDGSEHICVDRTLPLTKQDLKIIDCAIFTKIGENYILRGVFNSRGENIELEYNSHLADVIEGR